MSTQMMHKKNAVPAAIGAVCGSLCLAVIAVFLASPALTVSALVVGAVMGAALGAYTNTVSAPFVFRKEVPRDPIPSVFNNAIASEDGSAMSNKRLAKIAAFLMVAFVVMLVAWNM